ncbi:uncharacterized protein LOC112538653 [Tetranychus urticae]|uniref:Uncharacterized protein n=1 Tax=Tetranychus urticae TaxID=32264 RepID=T1K4V8_TETUR|nr:uncharacterized protein LOC112538653 [Tetranychus urticae]
MAQYINFSSSSTKQRSIAIGGIALVSTLITIGVVVTVNIKHKSSSTNNLELGEAKIKFIEPQWIPYVYRNTSLVNAFVAGTNSQSKSIYVCRVDLVRNPSDLLPGMFDPGKGCVVTYGGTSRRYLLAFEILVAKDPSVLVWESDAYGHAPIGALSGGLSGIKEELQISRVKIGSGQYIGKVHGRHSMAYVSYDGKEKAVSSYQVLCLQDYNL